MKLLIDTHAFLWWVNDDRKLTRPARNAIASSKNVCFFSVASAWELTIKASLGKIRLALPAIEFVQNQLAANGFELLPIGMSHLRRFAQMPHHHGDPFDRLLVAQALQEGLAMVSRDPSFEPYGVKTIG